MVNDDLPGSLEFALVGGMHDVTTGVGEFIS
jgi:hypothetical protein